MTNDHPQPHYGPPQGHQPYVSPPPRPTNTLAILALIFGILVPVVGIILGHISLSQIKKTGEEGRGLALAGTIVGYSLTGLSLLFLIGYLVFFALLFAALGPELMTGY